MIKKVMFAFVAVAFVSGMVYAGTQNDAGCGVGNLIFKDNNSAAPQVLAATTNGTFGNQTFGITSGTLGCAGGGISKMTQAQRAEKKQDAFVVQNWRNVNREMASGGGEYVSTLSKLMGCSKSSQGAFAHFAQTHYSSITGGPKAVPSQVIKGLRKALARDPNMSLSCSLI